MNIDSLQEYLDRYEVFDIENILNSFKSINSEIEIFLKEKAINFEKSSISSTNLVFDNKGQLVGYFTIANRSLIIPKEDLKTLSRTQLKKLSHSGAILRNGDLMTSSFLIAQVGKNYSIEEGNLITGNQLLTYVYELFLRIKKMINVKYLWLECQNEPKLISLYKDFGFKILENVISEEGLKVMIMELKYA